MATNNVIANKLEQLTKFPSVSGNERECALWLKKELKPFADKLFIDKVGNFIAIKGKPKIAIFAHMDKIGYMVSEVNKEGVKVVPLKKGKALPGEGHWLVEILGKEKAKGILIEKDKNKHELIVIVDKKEIVKISVGDFVALFPNFSLMGENLVCSQGLDNKLGVLAGCEIFKQSKDIVVVGTVREEAFKQGARIAAWKLKPKKVIVLDVTYDENPLKEYPIRIGFGPAICLKDDLLPDKELVSGLISTAKKHNIPYQQEVLESGGSDAGSVYDLYGGIPFVFIGIPIKFMHTPNEIGSFSDLGKTIILLSSFMQEVIQCRP